MKKVIAINAALMMVCSALMPAQEVETLFGDGMKTRFVWTFHTWTMSIQNNISTSIGVSGGVVLDETLIAGITVGSNLTHPRVNAGFSGLFVQYVQNPVKLVHWSGYVILGSGVVKDYEQPKSNAFDNFGNVFGAGFFFLEPGLNVEVNASKTVRIVTGLSYRMSSGIDRNNATVMLYRPTNADLSGLQWNFSLRFE